MLSPAHDRSLRRPRRRRRGRGVRSCCATGSRTTSRPGIVHAHAFVNHGKAAGASIEHPARAGGRARLRARRSSTAARPLRRRRNATSCTTRSTKRAASACLVERRRRRELVPAGVDDVRTRCACALPYGRQRFDSAADGEVRADRHRACATCSRGCATCSATSPYNVVVNTAPDRRRPAVPLVDRHRAAPQRHGRVRAGDGSVRLHRRARSGRRRRCASDA